MLERLATESLEKRAGALWPVSQRFSSEWLRNLSERQVAPTERLRTLYAALESFLDRDEVSPIAEHGFVEGAGAFLGVILIDHFAGAVHRTRAGKHRVQLGAHGYFDPFAAIERALEAEDPRATLTSELHEAEAEYRSEGPISRVVRVLDTRLRESRPELSIADQFDVDLALEHATSGERLEVDLRRAVDATRDQAPAAVEQVVSRLLSMLPGPNDADTSLLTQQAQLLPRLCREDVVRDLSQSGRTLLWSLPLVHGLVLTLQVESEGRARYVRDSEVRAAGFSDSAARALALENLTQRSERVRIVRTDTEHGPIYLTRTGDGRDSARVLLPMLYSALCERVGGRACVGIPHRDAFYACASDQPALVRELAARVAHDAARAPHRLSEQLFVLEPGGTLRCL
jgi:uncharacterized protein YtpQ (UPF0354 family)